MNELDQCVIDLHDIARQVEKVWGKEDGISQSIRHCADRLSAAISNTIKKQEERVE